MSGSAFTSDSNGSGPDERSTLAGDAGAPGWHRPRASRGAGWRPAPSAARLVAHLGGALGICAVVLAALGFLGGRAHAQFFSPGPLARPHAALEGLANCARCHDQERHHSPARCLSCHNELVPGIAKHTGLHGRMSAETRDECQRCHPDHRGTEFQMVDWQGPKARFQHERTGALLQGKHAKLACEACHDNSKVTAPDIVKLVAAQPRRATFLGLSPRCSSCHFDEHRGQLGRECQRCHNESSWAPSPPFDHRKADFALRGKHKTVPCGKCHPAVEDDELRADPSPSSPLKPARTTFMQMKPIEHDGCASCHDDPHEGKFGPRCASCHSEEGWKIVAAAGGAGRGFHNRTQFPLVGAHIDVACKSCHGPFPGRPAVYKGLAFARCRDCHEDAHVGQLVAARGRALPDCAACHDTNSFATAHFELAQHEKTTFPLQGAHRTVACRGCHALDPRLASLVPRPVRQKLRQEKRPVVVSTAIMRPKASPAACSTCHVDVHQGQFADLVAQKDCGGCHDTQSFTKVRFNHDVDSRFPLTGSHRTTNCASCHPRAQVRPRLALTTRYRPINTACASCHADQHQGQFTWEAASAAGPAMRWPGAGDCARCHQTVTFKETLFVHNDVRFTGFPLAGQHARLLCGACHRPVEVAAGVTTIRYRPLPTACADCHVDIHKGEFRGFEP
jgi:hypothetical protein